MTVMTVLLEDRQALSTTVNHCRDGGDSGSRESRTGENPVVETDLEKAARDHLNATKH
jgi:hypothetical protein